MTETLRFLRQRPAFAALVLSTLALGIGAPTAIFSVLHAVVLRPMPYPAADRVLSFRIESQSPRGTATFDALPVSTALAWAQSTDSLDAVGLFNDRSLTLTTADGPFRLAGAAVTPNLFALLRVAPTLGTGFDVTATDAHQIVLSDRTWRQYFGADPRIVGSSITLDGQSFRLLGVMPPQVQFPTHETAFWVPLLIDQGGSRGMMLPAIARLRDGATVAAALAEGQRWLQSEGERRVQFVLQARTLHEQLVGNTERVLWILMVAVSLVTVIATTNIALLLLVRGASRHREFAIRLALGAPRTRLIRQLFAEAVTLATIGGIAGIALAAGLLRLLLRTAPADIPRLQEADLNASVLIFALTLTAVASVTFAVLSAGRSVTIDPLRALGGASPESRLVSGGPRRRGLDALASAEIALTLVLLMGAGLLLRSFVAMVMIDHGFDADAAIAMQVTLPQARYPNANDRLAFLDRLLDVIRQRSDVAVAGLAITMPNRQPTARFAYDPDALPPQGDPFALKVAEVRTVSEGFFEAMGMRVLAGRTFDAADREGEEEVMVISRKLARVHFGAQNPVGRLLYSNSGTRKVIGVVDDVRPLGPTNDQGHAAYLPLRQDTGIFRWFAGVTVVVRATTGPDRTRFRFRDPAADLATPLRGIVLALDPAMPPFNVRTLDAELARVVAAPRFSAMALIVFAAVAMVLATIGVYAVVAFTSSQRTQEIAVRVALGATRGRVMRLVLQDAMAIVTVGLGIGLAGGLALAQTLAGLLYEVQPADPLALGAIAVLLTAVAMLAATVPARRATRINAVDALRVD